MKHLSFAWLGAILALVFGLLPAIASAATTGAITIAVTDELSAPLTSGVTASIRCFGDTSFHALTSLTAGTTTGASVCTTGQSPDFQIAKAGYITKVFASSTPTYNAAANETVNAYTASGIQFMLKSAVLQSEIGGAVTSLINGTSTNGTPSADVTLVGSNGVTIVASGVSSNVIYIAATGNGGGDDTITVQVQNATVDGGTADGAELAKATLLDSGNLIQAAAAQKTFDIGTGGSGNITTTGFKYPLKITVADELGTAATPDTITYNGSNAYYSASNVYYFATSTSGKALVINKDGYVNNATTNSGFSAVTLDQAAQTAITLGANAAAGSITNDAANAVKGLVFALKVTATKASDSSAANGGTVMAGDSFGVYCTESGSTGIYYCPIPVAQTGTVAQFIGGGYLYATTSYTDRTLATDAQGTASLSLYGGVQSGGGGSDPYYYTITHPGTGGGSPSSTPANTPATNPAAGNAGNSNSASPNQNPSQGFPPPGLTHASFSADFGLGEQGDTVGSLQTFLETKGFLTMPKGVAKGYFGALTRKALRAYQKSHGISQTGYLGPKTRAAINGEK